MKTIEYGSEYLHHLRNHSQDAYNALKDTARACQAEAFDIAEAVYWFAADWHPGQFTDLYRSLSTNPFSPSCIANGPEEGTAQDLYSAMSDTER